MKLLFLMISYYIVALPYPNSPWKNKWVYDKDFDDFFEVSLLPDSCYIRPVPDEIAIKNYMLHDGTTEVFYIHGGWVLENSCGKIIPTVIGIKEDKDCPWPFNAPLAETWNWYVQNPDSACSPTNRYYDAKGYRVWVSKSK